MKENNVISTHDLGEYSEGYNWKVVENYIAWISDDEEICEHASKRVVKTKIFNGKEHYRVEAVIPKAVVAYNEGGHNGTAVCLDCIKEKAL